MQSALNDVMDVKSALSLYESSLERSRYRKYISNIHVHYTKRFLKSAVAILLRLAEC